MSTRELTRQEMQHILNGRTGVLRSYSVTMRVVETVDNQGEQCGFCGYCDALVAVNIYATDQEHRDHCADACLGCIAYVVDNHIDINPVVPVVIEIARGVR